MNDQVIHQQKHGYRHGHRLLESTLRLIRTDQDIVDRLSDLSGQVRPGENIPPYLTVYPLPSRDYMVVGRTWPDLEAPRSGCVLTRSLLIPLDMWERTEDVSRFMDLLVPFSSNDELAPISSPSVVHQQGDVADQVTIELVEAIFLEARKPIVVFNAVDPDRLALRLLSALWPSFRSNFSLCTYALGTRKLVGREFDLLFAPKSARSRFSDWNGRKIEAGIPKSPRHRWSINLARSIFSSPHPSLIENDTLGLLAGDARGDESAFRKTLLWNDLSNKVENTPSAVLGMLDVLNSQPGTAQRVMGSVGPMLIAGIANSVADIPRDEAWQFLQTLDGKVRNRQEFALINGEIEKEAANLAKSSPNAAVEFTTRYNDQSEVLPTSLLIGLGEGLGSTQIEQRNLDRLPSRVGLFLLANSPGFTQSLAASVRDRKVSPEVPRRYLEIGDSLLRDNAAKLLLREVDSAVFAPLVPTLLSRASSVEFTQWILAIAKRTQLAVPDLDEAIVNSIRDDETMAAVRDAVISEFSGENADRFLVQTLQLLPHDIDWLLSAAISPSRSAKLLSTVVSQQADRALIEAQRDDASRSTILRILAKDASATSRQLARLLLLGAPSVEDLLEYGWLALPHLPESRLRQELLSVMFERGLSESASSDNKLAYLLADHISEIGSRQIIWWCTSQHIPPWRVSKNLCLLERMPIESRGFIERSIDELCERLAKWTDSDLEADGYAAWAALLWESRKVAPAAYLRGATFSLSATIDKTRLPVSDVVAAAFPGVYHELVARKEDNEVDGIISLVLSLPRMLVSDWDHAKPARHGLVDAFLESNWPQSHLLLAAVRADILDRICLRLTRQRGGKKFLKRAIEDLDRLDESEAEAIRFELSEFNNRNMKDDWD